MGKQREQKVVMVSGGFDDLRSGHFRFLEEAAKLGQLHVMLWDDFTVNAETSKPPKFHLPERLYMLQANRHIHEVHVVDRQSGKGGPPGSLQAYPDIWAVNASHASVTKMSFFSSWNIEYYVIANDLLKTFPDASPDPQPSDASRKKVIVTGCFDWFHSGHVCFLEEASELGDLYVVVGHDENVKQLKGERHPKFNQRERCYMVQCVKYVTQALISTGEGWLDAEPEVKRIKPDIYVVNEDGDRPEKQQFCEKYGMEYIVLKREPKTGLPRRDSTTLRGF